MSWMSPDRTSPSIGQSDKDYEEIERYSNNAVVVEHDVDTPGVPIISSR